MTHPRILTAFRHYEAETRWEAVRWERDFARLPPAHRQLLSGQPAKFAAVRRYLGNPFPNPFQDPGRTPWPAYQIMA